MQRVPLRRRLFVLVAAGLLPIAVAAGIALLALLREQRQQAERSAVEITRALATAVDAELRRSISVLEALATSPPLDKGDLAAFHVRAQRVLATRPFWTSINLADPSGRQLVNTDVALGAPLPSIVEMASFEAAARTRGPVVGRLAKGPRGSWAVPVRVPVFRDNELRYVLTAAVKPDAVLEVVKRQRVPDDWVVSVFDAGGLRVARSRAHEPTLGTPGAPSLQELMSRGGDEGWGLTRALEGDAVYAAYTRLPGHGWSVAIGIPQEVIEAGARRSLAVYGGGILLSLALGALVAGVLLRSDAARTREDAERERLLAAEQAARAAAESANRAKDEFLAMLGHELRNPLGAISNATRLLEHPRTDAEGSRHARAIISRQVDHLARMTDDLLDAGRASTGKIVLQRQPLDLAAAAAATLATLRPRTARHRVEHDLRSAWVDADPTRVEQIVANLVVNAAKYTPAGGRIVVSVDAEGDWATLRVRDEGIGMAPELTARAFDLFVQGERDLDRAHGGLGIGLTLVRRLAELHGGTAEAKSAGPNRGSEFAVRLPAIAAPPVEAPAAPAAQARPRRILVVEDNDDARETLRRLLELAGHRVRAERDGEAGVRAGLEAPFDVALVDIGLPKMDGYEVARRLRAAQQPDRRPFLVAISGYGALEDRRRALEAGFDEHLVKPVEERLLEQLLGRA